MANLTQNQFNQISAQQLQPYHMPVMPATTNVEALEGVSKEPRVQRARDYDKLSVAPFKAFLAAESQFSKWLTMGATTPAQTFPNDPVIHFLFLMLKEAEALSEMHNEIYSVDANGFNPNQGKSFFVFDMAYSTVQTLLSKVRDSLLVTSTNS